MPSVDPLDDQNFGSEIANLPFTSIIGGALVAVIDAQTQANVTTINFIQGAGFQPSKDKSKSNFGAPVMVEFKFSQPSGMLGMAHTTKIRVPFLTMIPIPTLRMDSVNIVFNVRLTQTRTANMNSVADKTSMNVSTSSTDKTKTENQTNAQGTTGWSYGGSQYDSQGYKGSSYTQKGWRDGLTSNTNWTNSSTMMGIVSEQASNSQGMTVSREFSIKVEVSAVQDKIPAGMERILDMLLTAVGKKPEASPIEGAMASAMGGATGGATGGTQ